VAGKGISAALLMASLQSSLRTQLADAAVSTSQMVGRVNQQLHASTAPEKFATFCAGVFNEASGVFTYTNAGHLPPLLVRQGSAERLDVNGMVVGAFPMAKYTESHVELHTGDLLVFFTDGISEPENAYGEMFGEDRLAELICRHAHLSEAQILDAIWNSVGEWSGDGELADDMTLLLARVTRSL
jgi:sigma-B regulation protein RsbU (phosphoserine phosphatase)